MAEENNNPERLGTGYSFDKEELRESMGWLIKLRWIGILGVLVGTQRYPSSLFLLSLFISFLDLRRYTIFISGGN